jgi:acyl carrier protein
VPGGDLIALRAKDAMEQVFAAKAKGLIHLHSILREVSLDFFVLCSSINAVLGEVGQVDQCAANGFLGMYAQATALTSSTPLTAIHWDLWKASGKRGLSADEGIAAFERALARPAVAEVTISTQSLDARIERAQALKVELSRAAAGASLVKQHDRPNLQTAYVAPRNEEEQTVAAIWQDALGINQIGIHDDFFELGGHSLLVTMMVSRLRDALGVDIPIDRLFHKPTIAGLMEARAELKTEQGGDVAEILDLLNELSDEDAEAELLRRVGGSDA